MGRMEPLSDLYHDNIIMPSAPRVLFRLLFRLPVKERGLSADAEGNAEDERDGGAEQTEPDDRHAKLSWVIHFHTIPQLNDLLL